MRLFPQKAFRFSRKGMILRLAALALLLLLLILGFVTYGPPLDHFVERRLASFLEEWFGPEAGFEDFSLSLARGDLRILGLSVILPETGTADPPGPGCPSALAIGSLHVTFGPSIHHPLTFGLLRVELDEVDVSIDQDEVRDFFRARFPKRERPNRQPRKYSFHMPSLQLTNGRVLFGQYRIPLEVKGDDISVTLAPLEEDGWVFGSLNAGSGEVMVEGYHIPYEGIEGVVNMSLDGLVVRHLRVASPAAYLSASGTLGFRPDGEIDRRLHISGLCHLERIAGIFELPFQASGPAGVSARVWEETREQWSVEGTVFGQHASVADIPLESYSLLVKVREGLLDIRRFDGRIFGGSCLGSLRMAPLSRDGVLDISAAVESIHIGSMLNLLVAERNWPRGVIDGEVNGQIPVNRWEQALASGKLNVHEEGEKKTALRLDSDPGVDGTIEFMTQNGRMNLFTEGITLGALHLSAAGPLDLVDGGASIDFQLQARSLKRFERGLAQLLLEKYPLIPAGIDAPPEPLRMSGNLLLDGSFQLRPHAGWRCEGWLQGDELNLANVCLGTVDGIVSISPDELKISAFEFDGGGKDGFSGHIDQLRWAFSADEEKAGTPGPRGGPLAPLQSAAGTVRNIPLDQLSRLLKGPECAGRRLDCRFKMSRNHGVDGMLRGWGAVTGEAWSVESWVFEETGINLQTGPEGILATARVEAGGGSMNISGRISPDLERTVFMVNGRGVDLPLISPLFIDEESGEPLFSAPFDVAGSGELIDGRLSLLFDLEYPILTSGELVFNGGNARLALSGGRTALHLTTRKTGNTVQGMVFTDRPDWPTLLMGSFPGLRIGLTAGTPDSTAEETEQGARVAGRFSLSGPLLDSNRMVLDGTVESSVLMTGEEYRLENRRPFVFRVDHGFDTVKIPPFTLQGPGSRISGGGRFSRSGVPSRILLVGTFDLGGLGFSTEQLRIDGSSVAELQVGGLYPDLSYTGLLNLTGGRLIMPDISLVCRDLDATVTWEPGQLELTGMSGILGGGRVTGFGSLSFGEGLEPDDYQFDFRGEDVVLNYPAKVSTLLDGELRLRGGSVVPSLTGRTVVKRLVYSGSIIGSEESAPVDVSIPAEDRADEDWLDRLRLNLQLNAPANLWIRSEEGTAQFNGQLQLEGTYGSPVVSGQVTAFPGGKFRFRGVEYLLEEALVNFTDPTGVEPVLFLKASTTVISTPREDRYQITMIVEGPFEDLSYHLTSIPQLNDSDIVSLLAFKRLSSDLPGAEGAMQVGQEVTAYFTGSYKEELEARFKEVLGLSRLEIQPVFLEGTTDPTARITVGKEVSDKFYITYSTNLSSTQDQLLLTKYRLNKKLSLLASSNEEKDSVGSDLQYQTSFKLRRKPPVEFEGNLDQDVPFPPVGQTTGPLEVSGTSLKVIDDLNFESEEPLPFRRGKLLRRLKLKPGKILDGKQLVDDQESLKRFLLSKGYYRCRIEPARIDKPVGGGEDTVDLVWHITTGPRYRLRTEGAPGGWSVSRLLLLRRTPFPWSLTKQIRDVWIGAEFFEDSVRRARDLVAGHFRKDGYAGAQVGTEERDQAEPGEKDLVFLINKGDSVKIESLAVQGSTEFTPEMIIALLARSEEGPVVKPGIRYVEQDVLRSLDRLRRRYYDRGFNRCRILHRMVELPRMTGGRSVLIQIDVDEGFRDILKEIRFQGLERTDREDLLAVMKSREGGPLNWRNLKDEESALTRYLDSRGYVDATVELKVEEEEEADSEGDLQAVLTIRVNEGLRYRVEDWEVEGNKLTRGKIIRQEMTLSPGDALSRAALFQSQRNLYRTGLFDQAAIEYQPLNEAKDGTVDTRLRIRVEERDNLQFTGAVGYDTEEKLRGLLQFNNINFMGARRLVGLSLRGSALEQRIILSGTEKRFLNRRDLEATLVGFATKEVKDSYDISRLGTSFQVTTDRRKKLHFQYGYRLEESRLDDVLIQEDVDEDREENIRLGRVRFSPIYDSRDDIFNPGRGNFATMELELFHETLGSDEHFFKSFGSYSHYHTLPWDTVWVSSLRIGLMGWPGGGVYLPLGERFYSGGSLSVRAFKKDRLGPLDPKTNLPLGGGGLFIFNQEMRVPVWGDLGVAVFADLGNVFSRATDLFRDFDLRYTAGLGLRYTTPVGPVRIEYSWKLDREPDESRGQFYFSIGYPF